MSHKISLKVINKINIFSLRDLQTIVKRCVDAFFPRILGRLLTVKEQLTVAMYYAIKVIIGCIVGNPPVMSVFNALLWSIETVSFICNYCFYLNGLFSVLQEMCSKGLDEQYTPNIVLLFCTALFFILMSLFLQIHYFVLTLCSV